LAGKGEKKKEGAEPRTSWKKKTLSKGESFSESNSKKGFSLSGAVWCHFLRGVAGGTKRIVKKEPSPDGRGRKRPCIGLKVKTVIQQRRWSVEEGAR